jgi:hypothetical protein
MNIQSNKNKIEVNNYKELENNKRSIQTFDLMRGLCCHVLAWHFYVRYNVRD